jgi:hypothetical protein
MLQKTIFILRPPRVQVFFKDTYITGHTYDFFKRNKFLLLAKLTLIPMEVAKQAAKTLKPDVISRNC